MTKQLPAASPPMTLSHFLFGIAIALIWGSMFVVAAIALRDFPPVFFTAIRFGLLTVIMAPFLRVKRRYILPLIKVGLVMGVGMYLTLYLALFLADNTATIALFSKLEVPFALLLGVVILGERIGIQRIAGISIAMLGAVVISFDPAAFGDLPALFWITVSSALYALSMIMVRQIGDGISALTITAWVSLVCAPVLMAISLLFESNHLAVLEAASWQSWLCLLYTVVMGSIVSHSGMYYLLQRYPISVVTPFSLLSPVFAVIGGLWLLDDQLTPPLIAGGLLVLLGVAWIYWRQAVKG
ncbi:MAG: DMT family transporter [Pseudomonadota bacterium]